MILYTICDAGMTAEQAAAKYTVSASWVRRLKQRRGETGEVAPRPQRHVPVPSWQARTWTRCREPIS